MSCLLHGSSDYFIHLLKFWPCAFKFLYFQKNSWPCWLDDITWASSGLSETFQVYLKTQSLLSGSTEFSIVITNWLCFAFLLGHKVSFSYHWWAKRLVRIIINILDMGLLIFVFFKTRIEYKRKNYKWLHFITVKWL